MAKRKTNWAIHLNKSPKKLNYTSSSQEVIVDKNKNYLQILNNSLVANVSVSAELAEQLNKISERLKNIPKIKTSN